MVRLNLTGTVMASQVFGEAMAQRTDGTPTPRGKRVLDHTPAGRFGEPADLVGALVWLCSPGAAFVSGVVVPIDGGFSAFSGV